MIFIRIGICILLGFLEVFIVNLEICSFERWKEEEEFMKEIGKIMIYCLYFLFKFLGGIFEMWVVLFYWVCLFL